MCSEPRMDDAEAPVRSLGDRRLEVRRIERIRDCANASRRAPGTRRTHSSCAPRACSSRSRRPHPARGASCGARAAGAARVGYTIISSSAHGSSRSRTSGFPRRRAASTTAGPIAYGASEARTRSTSSGSAAAAAQQLGRPPALPARRDPSPALQSSLPRHAVRRLDAGQRWTTAASPRPARDASVGVQW